MFIIPDGWNSKKVASGTTFILALRRHMSKKLIKSLLGIDVLTVTCKLSLWIAAIVCPKDVRQSGVNTANDTQSPQQFAKCYRAFFVI
jgi:hypothetical protein